MQRTAHKCRIRGMCAAGWIAHLALLASASLPNGAVGAPVAPAAPSQPQTFALLIGIGPGYANVPHLNALLGPPNDVVLMQNVLESRFSIPSDHITVLVEAQATHSAVAAAFAQLAQRIGQGDFVYIHYSGHGSHTADPRDPQGIDQTWIPYGARRGVMPGLDDHDIKDKEISSWLQPIYAKTANLVFVSDSCDSGSITRSASQVIPPGVREGPPDDRPHPADPTAIEIPGETPGIKIGATEDWDYAYEFDPDKPGEGECTSEEHCDGVFTWYWAKALMQAQPGESWYAVYSRAYSAIAQQPSALQRPQFTGSRQQTLVGQLSASERLSSRVTAVDAQNHRATLDSGAILGVTKGSTFTGTSTSITTAPSTAAGTILIDTVDTFSSQGTTSGAALQVGDLVSESQHLFESQPIRLGITGEFAATVDRPLLTTLKASLTGLPGFNLVSPLGDADLVLDLIRPRCNATDSCVLSKARPYLPESFKNSPPKLWLLNRGGHALPGTQGLALDPKGQSLGDLRQRLSGYARAAEFDSLEPATANTPTPIEVEVWQLRPSSACSSSCYFLPNDSQQKAAYERVNVVALPSPIIAARIGDAVTFSIKISDPDPWYVYIVHIDRSAGVVEPIFPLVTDNDGAAKIDPAHGTVRDLSHEYAFRIDGAGTDIIKFIATQEPLSVAAIERSGEVLTSSSSLGRLSALLANSARERGAADPVWSTLRTEIQTPAPAR